MVWAEMLPAGSSSALAPTTPYDKNRRTRQDINGKRNCL
jgi:hypothetical protein